MLFSRALLIPCLVAGTTGALAAPVCDGVSPAANTALESVVVAEGLTGRPLLVTAPPGDTERVFIVEQNGFVRLLRRGDAPTAHTLFIDISDRVSRLGNEMGLLGMAFDPAFEENGQFYLSYTRVDGGMIRSRVSRFTIDPNDPDLGDPDSESVVLQFLQPGQTNHNGGHIVFGPDGMLYMGSGDGGGSGDNHGECGNGQDTGTLLGSLLRIDPHGSGGRDCAEQGVYGIPADNPLVDGAGGNCDEIWSWGLRNPWRFSFDALTGDLYVADVGQNCWEEVNHVPAASAGGRNYGWRQMEGSHCYDAAQWWNCDPAPVSCGDSPECGDPSLTLPVLEYGHGDPCSISGGFAYRGCRMTRFQGTYFYGDYCDGFVRSLEIADGQAVNPRDWTAELGVGFGLSSFGEDAQGELYLTNLSTGRVFKIVPPLADLEVSGVGAAETFRLHREEAWTWEDLARATGRPVDGYRVYRRVPRDTFGCIFATPGTAWPSGGDPGLPQPGQLFLYLVTAVAGAEESASGSPPRDLDPCTL